MNAADSARPITPYAACTSQWLDWQRAYRFGVLLIVPPEPVYSLVNQLRAIHDPQSHAASHAHISLTAPLPRPMLPEHWQELQGIAGSLSPFTIDYGPLRHYLPYPGVTLRIEPQDALEQLCQTLEGASVFADAEARRYPFSAHLTIAEFITAERTLELMETLRDQAPTGSFCCDTVTYAVPDESFFFAERGHLRLG